MIDGFLTKGKSRAIMPIDVWLLDRLLILKARVQTGNHSAERQRVVIGHCVETRGCNWENFHAVAMRRAFSRPDMPSSTSRYSGPVCTRPSYFTGVTLAHEAGGCQEPGDKI
jgi:hypothetical protein